jgi:hypothetical protein
MSNFENQTTSQAIGRPRIIYELLCSIIRPKTQSDRTCFWKICLWADRKVRTKLKEPDFLELVVDYAREANGPDCKKPAAVFVSLLKRELKYPE